ncbi:EGH [Acanthosepion pharaonis]|uniref:EGH n=1 Tax=Acanthosepion pharaonis TaxID=158019 RepID=A0A812DZW7_ACAPH|nr:EGH [Sepia pharaonis]
MLPLDQKGTTKTGNHRKPYVPLRRQYRRVRIRMDGRLRHCLTVLLLFTVIAVSIFQASGIIAGNKSSLSLETLSGYKPSSLFILYLLRLLTLIPLPLTLFNFAGIISFNTFPRKPKLRGSTLFGPFICFRVVTKGLYPKLVRDNVTKNLEVCRRLGFDNYVFEVVTDETIHLPKLPCVREVVVPDDYCSSKGTLYKARALNYCLEEGVNYLNDGDWIVHLDEETLLTESSVIGVINFINEGKHDFGQGVITYADGEIVNWLTTLSDMVRVGMDYGMLRFCLKFLHKPVFSWKGSFIVSNAGVERKITYDFGPEGSIAEDCFFALSAWRDGYSFGFVEGDMHEKSTFSLMDYIKQRKRWVSIYWFKVYYLCYIYLYAICLSI